MAGLVVASPLLLLLGGLVRRNSKGGALYWQQRVGFGGRGFQMCKLRTMAEDAEEWTGAVWAMEDDPRVTSVGRFLRKFHLDELPQLWNIARGEMAFVGPRPERPEMTDDLSEEIPGYEHRLTVLPGVTGLAQVNLSPDQTIDCVRRKIELDLEYVFTAEPGLDVRILGCTTLKMLGVPCGTAAKLLLVSRSPGLARSTVSVALEDDFDRSAREAPAPSIDLEISPLETISEPTADTIQADIA